MFKIRASQLWQIMGKPKDSGGLTLRQSQDLEELLAKGSKSKRVQELIEKRDRPEGLSTTAKTYCKQWLKEKLFGRRIYFSNKYTRKGIEVEDQSIGILNSLLWESYDKNEEFRENDYMTGTADIVAPNMIRDIKSSWCLDTFPYFEDVLDQKYYYQMQAYMILWDKQRASVDYVLANTPWNLIEKEAYYKARDEAKDFEDVIEEIKHRHIFDDLPDSMRVKSFAVDRDYNLNVRIEEKVKACREYIKELQEDTDG